MNIIISHLNAKWTSIYVGEYVNGPKDNKNLYILHETVMVPKYPLAITFTNIEFRDIVIRLKSENITKSAITDWKGWLFLMPLKATVIKLPKITM